MTQSTELELECTFLAKALPVEIKGATPKRLIDIYIPESGTDHPRLRLRQKGDDFELTKKTPVQDSDASAHNEITIPLDVVEFNALSKSSAKRVIKDRYFVDINGHPAEVDVFLEELEGLVLIDFEFSSRSEQESFIAPSVCLADVTQENFIAGGLLAGKSYRDIKGELDRFEYVPLKMA